MKLQKLLKLLGFFSLFFITTFAGASDTALERIQKDGVFRVGMEPDYPPFSFYNEKNELVGFDVEVAKAVGAKLGVKVKFIEAAWDSLVAAFNAGKADILFNLSITDERKAKYDYTKPYVKGYTVIIVHKHNDDIKSFSDLKGKTTAVSVNSNFAMMAEQNGAKLVTIPDGFPTAIKLVIDKRVDSTVNDSITYFDFLKQKPDAPVKAAFIDTTAIPAAAIVHKGERSLVIAIDNALQELLEEGKIAQISLKYFGTDISK
ncbi:transporter substrate-binding domain-containing protein [Campylobacter sp. faydin G-24]|uniref:Transporter substrate-binding domain-containing protein n=1 Tax=Campylobacter anatolicus TaxID=2829105 RepID=A0ABS5HIS3_9BACT|nr:transporter substrate-binding domain-containing protein [Campylobacter anatolicus]MBR8461542.1 transporter substrate-binding domain-containing protein [Campylobacter anatolicus]MBR8464174.1 transporter substrate-binding domain-containing protein [Campylobacter anatolicus]MBR8466080.1 transporter substrate-binding domain-containing protein [Campylobacter anatolicus]